MWIVKKVIFMILQKRGRRRRPTRCWPFTLHTHKINLLFSRWFFGCSDMDADSLESVGAHSKRIRNSVHIFCGHFKWFFGIMGKTAQNSKLMNWLCERKTTLTADSSWDSWHRRDVNIMPCFANDWYPIGIAVCYSTIFHCFLSVFPVDCRRPTNDIYLPLGINDKEHISADSSHFQQSQQLLTTHSDLSFGGSEICRVLCSAKLEWMLSTVMTDVVVDECKNGFLNAGIGTIRDSRYSQRTNWKQKRKKMDVCLCQDKRVDVDMTTQSNWTTQLYLIIVSRMGRTDENMKFCDEIKRLRIIAIR